MRLRSSTVALFALVPGESAREGRARAAGNHGAGGGRKWGRGPGKRRGRGARREGGAGSGRAPLLVLVQAVQDGVARFGMRGAKLSEISSAGGIQPGRLELQGGAAFGAQPSSFRPGLASRLDGAKATADLIVATDHVLTQHERIAAANVGDNLCYNSPLKSAMVSKVIPIGFDAISQCPKSNRDFPAKLNYNFGAGRIDTYCAKTIW